MKMLKLSQVEERGGALISAGFEVRVDLPVDQLLRVNFVLFDCAG